MKSRASGRADRTSILLSLPILAPLHHHATSTKHSMGCSVRPETLVRICDECNFGTYGGRCCVCGSPGISDAYYCAECTRLEKDRDGCPKIVNLGASRWVSGTCRSFEKQADRHPFLQNGHVLRAEESTRLPERLNASPVLCVAPELLLVCRISVFVVPTKSHLERAMMGAEDGS